MIVLAMALAAATRCPVIRVGRAADNIAFMILSARMTPDATQVFRYRWRVRGGDILSGQGTDAIGVRVHLGAGISIDVVASVEIAGLPRGCPRRSRFVWRERGLNGEPPGTPLPRSRPRAMRSS